MPTAVVALPTNEEVRDFVCKTLCERDRLDTATTPFMATPLQRGGRWCGVLFHVEGPRMLRNSAVWSGDEHRILFYDSTGARFHEVRLSESPTPESKAALPG